MDFRSQFDGKVAHDQEHFSGESPVVSGQALTGAELFRRISSGLPVGCALRQFNQVNPYLEKFSIYDNINAFRIRHGMVDKSEFENVSPPGDAEPKSEPSKEPSSATNPE